MSMNAAMLVVQVLISTTCYSQSLLYMPLDVVLCVLITGHSRRLHHVHTHRNTALGELKSFSVSCHYTTAGTKSNI